MTLLTFALAGERCALALDDVREIVRAVAPARLPKAPPVVAGVLNVRGELVPLLDLRRRFGLPPRAVDPDDHMVIAVAGGRIVAFAVERADELLRIPRERISAAAQTVAGAEHVGGIARLDDGLLVIYDLLAFLSGPEGLALDRAVAVRTS